jgi:hypothetical protein
MFPVRVRVPGSGSGFCRIHGVERRRRRQHDQHVLDRREVHGRLDHDGAEHPGAPLDRFYLTYHKALRVDTVDAGRHHHVPDLHVRGARHVLHPEPVATRSKHHALRPRALHERTGRGVPVDQQLHLRRARARHDDPADDTARRDHRLIGPEPFGRPLVDRDGPEVGARAARDDRRARRREVRPLAKLEQVLQTPALLCERPLLLQLDLQLSNLLTETLVFVTHVLQREVPLPSVAGARDHGAGRPLHFGKHAEGHRLEHRHAAPGVDLRGNEDDVADRDGHEQVPGALPEVEEGHC